MPPPAPRRGPARPGALAAAPAAIDGSSAATAKAIAAGRTSGAIALPARGLAAIPAAVYDPDAGGCDGGGAWWEAAHLTRLDLSRNEISAVPPQLELPPGLAQLSELRALTLSGNPLGALPPPAAGRAALGRSGSSLAARRVAADAAWGGAAAAADADAAGPGAGLPDEAAALPALASLAAADCGLESLPDALGDARAQPALAALALSGNRLARLPPGLAGASALVRLELAGNRLARLEGAMVLGWQALRELDVSDNQLELGALPRLRCLHARRNRLAALPDALAGCSSLVELHVGFNAIEALPEALGRVRGLAVLELRHNLLTEFPAALCGLPLTLLDLTANSLRSLPPELGLMTTLRSVPLDGNPLKLVRREVWAGPVSALLEHLRSRLPDPAARPADGPPAPPSAAVQPRPAARPPSGGAGGVGSAAGAGAAAAPGGCRELMLQGRGLSDLPHEMSDPAAAAALARADLGKNPALGAAIARRGGLPAMPRLRGLGLAGCGVAEWPLPRQGPSGGGEPAAEGGALAALQSLDLRGNPLSELPAGGLSCCPDLRLLDLSGAPASAVARMPPPFLAPAPRLEALLLAGCRMAAAPWGALRAAAGGLRRLDLSGNDLSDLPPFISEFKRLEELDLSNNALTGLPPQLGLLAPSRGGALRALMVGGNAIRTVRRPLLEGSTPALLDYLLTRLPE
ncbi:hypothetical protein Rsub_12736 [Raphidocelis subcapitata]|uniref:Uncharacterized protein n=1 Tax=Raphidocelis subcapitata TaxID=307507 RepID=A0A2V0PK01_9CHLO|nr:hypothetical protein Rsub_12736 [Raphidocelis subcapitata]|eukprot:GBG00125.1 hypothetical protein Rsub_12736 [Raphidocelis subcapitata]